MQQPIKLRCATRADADLLLKWRNDPDTRQASQNTGIVEPAEHIAWLEDSLENPARRLLIAEQGGSAVGTVRADFDGDVWELSWTVAPKARGQGIAKRMVAAVASEIAEPVAARVKPGNETSVRIATGCGMTLIEEAEGMLYFRRGALDADQRNSEPFRSKRH